MCSSFFVFGVMILCVSSKFTTANITITIPKYIPLKIAYTPIRKNNTFTRSEERLRVDFHPKIQAAKAGKINNVMIIAAISAKVLVKANGLNSFPSAPIMVNTGIKLMIVVRTDVRIAPETSFVAS